MDLSSVRYLMLKRQHFIEKADEAEYEKLFRFLSPVHTKFWIVPGSPPVIEHRTRTNDFALNSNLRKNRKILKGRFQGGLVGYVYDDELPLYMAVYKKSLKGLSEIDEAVLGTIKDEGPMNIRLIKEITGLLSKQIAASLQKMQKAFIVYEDQVDGERDRAWYILEEEFSTEDLSKYDFDFAIEEIIYRFSFMNVFVDEVMIKSFTRLKNSDINSAVDRMVKKGRLERVSVEDIEGYILKEDKDLLERIEERVPDDIFILDLNDFLVRSNEEKLKIRFGKKQFKTMYYIIKQGEFIGAVFGRFTFGPYEFEDIDIDLSQEKQKEIKTRILDELYMIHDKEKSPLKRYCGEKI